MGFIFHSNQGGTPLFCECTPMLDQRLIANVEMNYRARQAQLAMRLDAKLHAATNSARAVRHAAKNMRARCEAARAAISETFESQRGAAASATDLALLFDRLIAGEPGSCVGAVASVAGRLDNPTTTMAAAQTAVMRAYERERADVLRHLAEDADESQQRLRPLPIRLVRNGINTLIGGGLLWRGCLWVNQHWPAITAHFHH